MSSRLPTMWLAFVVALGSFDMACLGGDSCDPGDERACTVVRDGGVAQRGYQSCGSRAEWSACLPVGACSGAALPVYARCDADDACGPTGCAVCGYYGALNNPEGYRVCYPYCQRDSDCVPDSPATGITARCVLGQCALYCTARSVCPRETQCLRWATAAATASNPGYDGICN
jgi:hypothetical protein